jgi:uncharacterized surface protein with fasciclin (FAS1) repeats
VCLRFVRALRDADPGLYGVGAGYGGFPVGGSTTVIVTGRKLAQQPGCRSALEVLQATPQLSRLASLAGGAAPSLTGALQQRSGSAFTLFAPSNGALESLLRALPDAGAPTPELVRNQTMLTNLLAYHVVPGAALAAADLRDGQQLQTLLGSAVRPLAVAKAGGSVTIRAVASQAKVVQPDLRTCTGVVHVIDNVLLPVQPGGAAARAPAARG